MRDLTGRTREYLDGYRDALEDFDTTFQNQKYRQARIDLGELRITFWQKNHNWWLRLSIFNSVVVIAYGPLYWLVSWQVATLWWIAAGLINMIGWLVVSNKSDRNHRRYMRKMAELSTQHAKVVTAEVTESSNG